MKPKKILILVIGLLFTMPMFGQRLNSRGEKMVQEIMYYSKRDTCRITYTYDENDEVKTMALTSLKTGYGVTLTKTEKGIDIVMDSFRSNHPVTKNEKTYVRLNEDGNISCIEERDYCYDDGDYSCTQCVYEYINDDYSGRKVLNKRTISRGLGSGKMTIEGRKMYAVENGNTYYKECNEDWSVEEDGTKEVYSIEKNDININYPYMLLYGEVATYPSNLLFISPWCPMAFKNFKLGEANKNGKLYQKYNFTKVDGNITRISLEKMSFKEGSPYRIPYAMDITYVEE